MKEKVRNTLEIIAIIVCSFIIIVVLVFYKGVTAGKDFEDKANNYSILVVNGVEYETRDIQKIICYPMLYTDNQFEITLKDGTLIRCYYMNCTFKNKS